MRQDYDLVMTYFKSVDNVSHPYWKYFQPWDFDPIDPEELERHQGIVPSAYTAVDNAVDRLVTAAGPETNVIILSDHGFYSMRREQVRVRIDFDRLLENLGFLAYQEGGIDLARTRVYTHATPAYRKVKRLRFGGSVGRADRNAVRAELTKELERVTWPGSQPTFRVRDANTKPQEQGADFVVEVLTEGLANFLRLDGARLDRVVTGLERLSGSHGGGTKGIFLAFGPNIDPNADVEGMSIHDITPTLLYGMGLPVADDFDGRVWRGLYTAEFRAKNPLKSRAALPVAAPGRILSLSGGLAGVAVSSSITLASSTSATPFGSPAPTSATSTKIARISASVRTRRLAGP